ncbi:hypothetical protein Trydic_g6288 [Trypoxylus dichotomus]
MYNLKKILAKISTSKSYDLRNEVYVFNLQLLHERIEISAGGFFQVDGRVVFSIIAAIVTHTVILIQFDPRMMEMV